MSKNNQTQTKISPWQKISLIIFGLFLSLVLLEITLRLGGFIFLSLQEYRNRLSLKHKGACRILCLGESTTADQYPYFLEEILNQRNIGIKFNVIDKGMRGTNSSLILGQLEYNLGRYHPDMIVTMMGANDGGAHMPYQDITSSKAVLFLRSFRVYKLARLLWLHIIKKTEALGLLKSKEGGLIRENVAFRPELTRDGPAQPIAPGIWNGSLEKSISKDERSYIEFARSNQNQGRNEEAQEALRRVIELNPNNEWTYIALALCYHEVRNGGQAEKYLKRAIKINPGEQTAYCELGRIYHETGQPAEAEEAFKKAAELNPTNPYPHAHLAMCYQMQKKFIQAEESYKKALALDRSDGSVWIYINLADCYSVQHNFSMAEKTLQEAMRVAPNNPRLYGAFFILYEMMGRYNLAQEYYRKSSELRSKYYSPLTVTNYRKLKGILDRKGIQLVCVQYPVRNVDSLKKIFQGQTNGMIFVDNEKIFKEAIKNEGYSKYFTDMFGGDFGHCTDKGNRLLAGNIANVILKEVFGK